MSCHGLRGFHGVCGLLEIPEFVVFHLKGGCFNISSGGSRDFRGSRGFHSRDFCGSRAFHCETGTIPFPSNPSQHSNKFRHFSTTFAQGKRYGKTFHKVSKSNSVFIRNENSAQRPKFSAGRPCGHPAKNFGQALQILEKQAFRHGHAARTSTKKLRSEKLRADFSFPILGNKIWGPS